METNLNTTKRKKRKTRKCLDEIRKRARRTGQILIENNNSNVCNMFSNYNKLSNCIITNNRLTLSMFPKAVRSETITRPALADLKRRPNLNFEDFVKDNKMIGTLNITRLSEHNANSRIENIKLVCNRRPSKESYNYEESFNKVVNNQEARVTENSDLFTSMDSTEITDKSPNNSIGAQSASTITTSSNQSLHDDYGYNLYEEFMSEIPMYLKRNATFIEDDVMKKTKVFLQNLFTESCYQECEDNVLKCIKNNTIKKNYYTPSEIIVHNPMDYIRLGHIQHKSLFNQSSRNGGIIADNCSTPHSPLMAPTSPAASPNSPLSVIVHDTPEYAYYPHRLN